MTQVNLIKYSALSQALAAAQLATNQATSAATAAAAATGVDPDYISYTVGTEPDFTGAPAGTIGGYFTSVGTYQLLEYDGATAAEIGSPLAVGASTSPNKNALFVSKNSAAADYNDIQDAIDALSSEGGTVIVDCLDDADADYEGFTITTDNVAIIGVKPGEIDYVNGYITGYGVRIEGTCTVTANNCTIANLGIQSIYPEGDCFTAGGTKQNLTVLNCRMVGLSRASAYHCMVIEGMQQYYIANIRTFNNVWGVALKDDKGTLNGLYSRNHNNGGLIIKSDSSNTVQSVHCSNIVYESTTSTSGGIWIQAALTSTLQDVSITNATSQKGHFTISIAVGATMKDITLTGCHSRDANTYGFTFSGDNSGAINLIGCSEEGAGTGSIQGDGFDNVNYVGCNFKGTIDGVMNFSRRSVGNTVEKAVVADNTATDIATVTFDNPFDGQTYLVSLMSNSTSTIYSSVWVLTAAYDQIATALLAESKLGITSGALTATINNATNVITLTSQIDNTSDQEMRVLLDIVPIGLGSRQILVKEA